MIFPGFFYHFAELATHSIRGKYVINRWIKWHFEGFKSHNNLILIVDLLKITLFFDFGSKQTHLTNECRIHVDPVCTPGSSQDPYSVLNKEHIFSIILEGSLNTLENKMCICKNFRHRPLKEAGFIKYAVLRAFDTKKLWASRHLTHLPH